MRKATLRLATNHSGIGQQDFGLSERVGLESLNQAEHGLILQSQMPEGIFQEQRASDEELRELLAAVHRETLSYTIGFLNKGNCIGSGILVRTETFFGVLTAKHVVEAFPTDEVGVIFEERLSRFTIQVADLQPVPLPPALVSFRHGSKIPDLALLQVADLERLNTLKAKKDFYRFERSAALANISQPGTAAVAVGIVGEMSEVLADGSHQIGVFSGATQLGISMKEFGSITVNGFELVPSMMIRGERPFPMSAGGMSGGGLWVPVQDATNRSNVYPYLFGVLFLEEYSEGHLTLWAHSLPSAVPHLLGGIESTGRPDV